MRVIVLKAKDDPVLESYVLRLSPKIIRFKTFTKYFFDPAIIRSKGFESNKQFKSFCLNTSRINKRNYKQTKPEDVYISSVEWDKLGGGYL